jgi:hypothetical protein
MFMDVVIFNPGKIQTTTDENILEFTYNEAITITDYPTKETDIVYTTTAYNAVQEYGQMIYADENVGVYTNRQFRKAKSVVLNAMYEELDILWAAELNLRTGFNTENQLVTMPVLFAKICGVKDGNKKEYVIDVRLFRIT